MAPDETSVYSHIPQKTVPPRRVFVRDYVTDAEIGVWTHEKGKTQKVRINVDLVVQETEQHHEDQLENVVCYNDVVLGIRKIVTSGHINLVETLAEQIADLSLGHSDVVSVRVRVEKLEAVPEAASVGVEIDRHR